MSDIQRLRTVHTIGLVIESRKEAGLEHIKAGDRETLTPPVTPICPNFVVDPLTAGTSVQQDRHEEEVEEAFGFLFDIRC
jgi:hypothetical protein